MGPAKKTLKAQILERIIVQKLNIYDLLTEYTKKM